MRARTRCSTDDGAARNVTAELHAVNGTTRVDNGDLFANGTALSVHATSKKPAINVAQQRDDARTRAAGMDGV